MHWHKGMKRWRIHFGIAHTKAIASCYMWWSELITDRLRRWRKELHSHCQKAKNAPPVIPLHSWSFPSMPCSRTHRICRIIPATSISHSCWFSLKVPEVVTMKNTSAEITICMLPALMLWSPEQQWPTVYVQRIYNFLKSKGIKHICSMYIPSFIKWHCWTFCAKV